MRRLLYLALALVFLAVTGLAFVRVTNAGAYVARSRLMKIHVGMSRDEVQLLMADCREIDFLNQTWVVDSEHSVGVAYDDGKVVAAWVNEPEEKTSLGRLLDFLGFNSVTEVADME